MTNLKLAKDPETTSETLELLATDDNCDVRQWVANHPNTSPETLQLLATDDFWWAIRCGVAKHSNTPVETLELLATDDILYVRYHAAHHSNATEIVRRLFLMTEAQKK